MGIEKFWPRRTGAKTASASSEPPRPKAQRESGNHVDARWVNAYLRQIRSALGKDAIAPATDAPFDSELAREADRAFRKSRAQALFAQAIGHGRPLEDALVESVDSLLRMGEAHSARALAMGAWRLPGGERAGRLGTGLGAHRRRCMAFAWQQFSKLSDEDLATWAPTPAVEAALAVGTDAAHARARAIATRLQLLTDPAVIDLAGRFLAAGDHATARALWDEAMRRDCSTLAEQHRRVRSVLQNWFQAQRTIGPEPDGVVVGLLDQRHPADDGTSRNIGNDAQTLAILGNLSRFQQVTFAREDGTDALATELQNAVRPDARRNDVTARVSTVAVDRHFSNGGDVPPRTWTFVHGSHSRRLFNIRYDFPYHPNVRPIFVSFDIDDVEMLTPGAIAYLREYGPVGCRTWSTVYLLLSAGVDAFFTGCINTTLDVVFPPCDGNDSDSRGVAVVDVPRNAVAKRMRKQSEFMSEVSTELGLAPLADGLRAASSRLYTYQRQFRRVVTRSLDTYTSAVSVGVPVKYLPRSEGDLHHDGLLGLRPDSADLRAMGAGIRELLDSVLPLILSGADESSVYAHWREITQDRVRQARAGMTAPVATSEPTLDLPEALRLIAAERREYGPRADVTYGSVTDVALSLDQNLKSYLPVTVESMLANASGRVRLWITCRGLDEGYQQWFAGAFPDVPITFLPFDHIHYGDLHHLARRITMTTMDRLLLPDVLREVDRIVYLDIDTVTVGDVCVLGNADLDGAPLAGISRNVSATRIWRAASNLLDSQTGPELRRRIATKYPFDYPSMNAGVLVLDLARMRDDRFTEVFLPWVERYGLNDQDVLIAYVGPNRVVLEPRWNFRPFVEDVENPAIIHYAHGGKPWYADLCPYQAEWWHYAEQFRARAGNPPG